MKKIVFALLALGMSTQAFAATIVGYEQWTSLPYCGGQTRLTCDNVENARARNRCYIQFRNVVNCDTAKLYVADNFHPQAVTSVVPLVQDWLNLDGTFYVDDSKVYNRVFNVYLTSGPNNTTYDQIQYQFNY